MGRGHKKLIYGRELPKNEGGGGHGQITDLRGRARGLAKKKGAMFLRV